MEVKPCSTKVLIEYIILVFLVKGFQDKYGVYCHVFALLYKSIVLITFA